VQQLNLPCHHPLPHHTELSSVFTFPIRKKIKITVSPTQKVPLIEIKITITPTQNATNSCKHFSYEKDETSLVPLMAVHLMILELSGTTWKGGNAGTENMQSLNCLSIAIHTYSSEVKKKQEPAVLQNIELKEIQLHFLFLKLGRTNSTCWKSCVITL
jgi:hypothetical protein